MTGVKCLFRFWKGYWINGLKYLFGCLMKRGRICCRAQLFIPIARNLFETHQSSSRRLQDQYEYRTQTATSSAKDNGVGHGSDDHPCRPAFSNPQNLV